MSKENKYRLSITNSRFAFNYWFKNECRMFFLDLDIFFFMISFSKSNTTSGRQSSCVASMAALPKISSPHSM